MNIRYEFSFSHPASHLVQVRMEITGLPADVTELVLPSWVPGSYKIRDFARHLQDFSAGDHKWKKTAKNRWRVIHPGARTIVVEYQVFCFELTVQSSHVDDTHAFLNPGNLLLYIDGMKDVSSKVALKVPRGWKVATALNPVPGARNTFFAPNYDILLDSPIEAGKYKEFTFRVRGIPHRIILHGEGNYEEKKLVRDVKKICEAEVKMMRDIPYFHYTFFIHTTEKVGGGLEHLNSTAVQIPRFLFKPREKYENCLELIAHEFFHLWNVKRIHPDVLGPFDYEKEVYTTLLWVMEGITSYYDVLFLPRARLISPERYLRKVADRIQKFETRPARKHQSLSASSFDTWIKLYQPNENAVNSVMSYYQKGELLGIPLDLEIRRCTKNQKSLDDVMRLLYKEWAMEGKGFPERVFQETVEKVAGRSFKTFFNDYIHGTKEIDWNRYLRVAGLRLKKEKKKSEDSHGAYLGVQTQRTSGRLMISAVLEDSPAWRDGLSARDEILALDKFRIDPEQWEKRISDRKPGDKIEITVFRAGVLRTIPVTLGEQWGETYRIERLPKVQAQQRKVFQSWVWNPWKK